MLDFREVERHLEKIKYKRDWSISVAEVPLFSGKMFLQVSFYPEDSYNPGTTIKIGMREPLQPCHTVEELEHRVLGFLDRCERHETREWFKIDGVAKYDLHRTAA